MASVRETTELICTKCDVIMKPKTVSDTNVHPLLKVLVCNKCRYFYDQKQFYSKNGFCQWCLKDQMLCDCSKCSSKFCEDCIKKNFRLTRTVFRKIKEHAWKCCVCDPRPIWFQRAICSATKDFVDSSDIVLLKERTAEYDVQLFIQEKKVCVICCSEVRTMLVYPCGHKCLCKECALLILDLEKKMCPLCQDEVKDIIRVY